MSQNWGVPKNKYSRSYLVLVCPDVTIQVVMNQVTEAQVASLQRWQAMDSLTFGEVSGPAVQKLKMMLLQKALTKQSSQAFPKETVYQDPKKNTVSKKTKLYILYGTWPPPINHHQSPITTHLVIQWGLKWKSPCATSRTSLHLAHLASVHQAQDWMGKKIWNWHKMSTSHSWLRNSVSSIFPVDSKHSQTKEKRSPSSIPAVFFPGRNPSHVVLRSPTAQSVAAPQDWRQNCSKTWVGPPPRMPVANEGLGWDPRA